mmetsp:Transcript_4397/g.12386  ORF Transcript_4397/g.12386 Transcript_4397/m.12386 type:complete len:213 (-) Transcript_4397:1191-1829(-)
MPKCPAGRVPLGFPAGVSVLTKTCAWRPGKKDGCSESRNEYWPGPTSVAPGVSVPACRARPWVTMMRSTRPWICSKPEVPGSMHTADTRRSFLAPTSAEGSWSTMSDTSKYFQGKASLRLEAAVLRSPGTRLVRHSSKSVVLGLPMVTAVLPSSLSCIAAKASSWEHRAKHSVSVYPAAASSWRMSSWSAFRGCWPPWLFTKGTTRGILLME